MDKKMNKTIFVNAEWKTGSGDSFNSVDPASGEVIWSGNSASENDVDQAFKAAKSAFETWSMLPVEERLAIVERFKTIALEGKPHMAELIARETGKVLWDATGEGGAISGKADISVTAYKDRTGGMERETAFGRASLQHRGHGVMAVLGPYNFPAHLPNGQILPALIAGNTVVFKPSEQCPAVGEALTKLYAEAGFPAGVINMVQGGRDTGAAVLSHPDVDGVLFTGSAKTGAFIHKMFGGRPEIILALEMGGNNPLIAWDVEDTRAAASMIVQSAFVTSGQRCTCARRLIIPVGVAGDKILKSVIDMTHALTLGAWNAAETASIGPVISADIAGFVVKSAAALEDFGAKTLKPAKISPLGAAFVEPGIYDVTGCDVPDEEIFGPVLQVVREHNWDAAIKAANNTKFGLAAGLISDKMEHWDNFKARIRAGVVNFNRPTTGAAGFLPFGGPGASGNHNPGAYYAADFCAWPMASQVADMPEFMPMQGLKA